jgi:phospholipid/cholesterol/gamma-HCH transport system permease protein
MFAFKKKLKDFLFTVGEISILFKNFLYCSVTKPFYYNRLVEQIVQLGIGSISITAIIGVVTGLIMTLEFGHGLAKFGGTLYVPGIVSLSLIREMSPVLTSLLVAARVSSGIAAEVGSMNVSEQIDAIRALGTSPIRVIVVPRVLACIISVPLLAVMSSFLGILSGMLIANLEFSISPGFFINKALQIVHMNDLFGGLIKVFCFSFLIALIPCYKGFKTSEGTRGVGNTTTWAIVVTSISILICDFFLSKILIMTISSYD